jgi:hypothetical protein
MRIPRLSRFSMAASGMSGRHVSWFCGNRIPSGMTPMIVHATSLTLIDWPMTAGSLP